MLTAFCGNNLKFYIQYLSAFSFPVSGIFILKKASNFELFVHMPLKFEITWTRIGQVIRLQNDINFSKTLSVCAPVCVCVCVQMRTKILYTVT